MFIIVMSIIAIIFAIYMFRVIDGIEHNHLHFSDILVLILCFVVIFMAKSTDNAYNSGYNDAIHNAKLVGIGEHTYQLQFGDDIHEYTFD